MSEVEFPLDGDVADEPKADAKAEPDAKADEPTGETKADDKPDESKDKSDKEPDKDGSSPDPEQTTVPIAALHGERDRRQEAERELNDLKAKQVETDKADPTSVFADEGKFRTEIEQSFDDRLTHQSLNQSEFFAARDFGKDVLAAKVETFKQLAADNPSLAQRFSGAISPYHELVEIVNQHETLNELKDVDALKAKLKEEARAELKAEQEAEAKEKGDLRDSIPESLVGDSSKGGLKGSDWSGPTSDDALFEGR